MSGAPCAPSREGSSVAYRMRRRANASLATAKKIAKACRDYAAGKGFAGSIFILDNAGEYIHMERGDGQVFAIAMDDIPRATDR